MVFSLINIITKLKSFFQYLPLSCPENTDQDPDSLNFLCSTSLRIKKSAAPHLGVPSLPAADAG